MGKHWPSMDGWVPDPTRPGFLMHPEENVLRTPDGRVWLAELIDVWTQRAAEAVEEAALAVARDEDPVDGLRETHRREPA